ncbi:RES domain-containing protein [Fibrobacter succinogenes]|uniref:RES domain-containing protein n=1 Tax=Fibrobacter succinogenes TaxID=833 RepID=UPI00156415A8|nr:RES domain-containing protein [Fibrobacter succinogenes]
MSMTEDEVNEAVELCEKMKGRIPKYPLIHSFENVVNADDALMHPKENLSGKSYCEFICELFAKIRTNVDNFRKKVALHLRLISMQTTYAEYAALTQNILDSCDAIQNVLLECFQNSDKETGYDILKSFLELHLSDIVSFETLPQTPKDDAVKYLYKLADKRKSLKKKGYLFHPPFDVNKNNHLNYRYSGEDFPSLYLGCSLDVCLAEMNSTNKNDFYASQFKLNDEESLTVLNFGYRWKEIYSFCHADVKEKDKINFLKGWLTLYPLMLACSIVKISETKDEYVLPQLLMRYIKESTSLDGIRYYSTKKCYVNSWTKKSLNFAFPAKGNKASGYDDDLVRKFKLTDPIDLLESESLDAAKETLSTKTFEHMLSDEDTK